MNIVRVWISEPNRYGRAVPVMLDEHVSAASGESQWLPVADVILCPDVSPHERAESTPAKPPAKTVAETLARYPGSLVVACLRAGSTPVIGTRDGQILEFGGPEPWMTASAAHAWTVAGGRLGELPDILIKKAAGGPGPAIPAGAGPVLLVARRAG